MKRGKQLYNIKADLHTHTVNSGHGINSQELPLIKV